MTCSFSVDSEFKIGENCEQTSGPSPAMLMEGNSYRHCLKIANELYEAEDICEQVFGQKKKNHKFAFKCCHLFKV